MPKELDINSKLESKQSTGQFSSLSLPVGLVTITLLSATNTIV